MSHKKGVYIDGHEREDVRHRKSLLKTLHDLCGAHKPPPPCSDEPTCIRQEDDKDKELVRKSDQQFCQLKTRGSGIIVLHFVEEHGGYLKLTDEEFERVKEEYPSIIPEV